MKYDVFISCRKMSEQKCADDLVKQLRREGLRVFYKPVSVGAGEFNEIRKKALLSADTVIAVFSPDSLTFCVNPQDPVRAELYKAVSADKNIVCLKTGGFEFSAVLPNELSPLRYKKSLVPEAVDTSLLMKEVLSLSGLSPNNDRKRRKQLVTLIISCASVFLLLLWAGASVSGANKSLRSGVSPEQQRQSAPPAEKDGPREMPPLPPGADPSKPVINLAELWKAVFTAAADGKTEEALLKLGEFKKIMEEMSKEALPAFPVLEQYVKQIPAEQKPFTAASEVSAAAAAGKPVHLPGGGVIMQIPNKTAYSGQYQQGDIIYAVNGTIVLSNRDLHEARIDNKENTISVLRWNGKSFSAVDTKVHGKDSLGVALRVFSLQ